MDKVIRSLPLIFLLNTLPLQAQIYKRGDVIADIYIGGPNFFSMDGFLNDNIYDHLDRKVQIVDSANSILDLVYFGGKFEYVLSKKIGIGLHFNNSINSVKGIIENDMFGFGLGNEYYPYKATFMSYRIIPMLIYHLYWDDNELIDPYIAFGIGYAFRDMKVTTANPYYKKGSVDNHLSPLAYRAEIGIRYYLSKHFGYLVAGGLGGGPIVIGGISAQF